MKTVVTRELWAASYLYAKGIRLLKTIPGYWVGFEFDDTDGQASKALNDWYASDVQVSARDFVAAHRVLKRATYTAQVA